MTMISLPELSLDLEVQSLAKLKTVSTYVYATDPSTNIASAAMNFRGREILVALLGRPDSFCPDYEVVDDLPDDVREYLENGGHVTSWNVEFEHTVWNAQADKLGWPKLSPYQCECAMAAAAAKAHPQGLEACGDFLGLDIVKSDNKAMMKICVDPDKKTGEFKYSPEELIEMYNYNVQDVRSERAILEVIGPCTEPENFSIHLDICSRGAYINTDVVKFLMHYRDTYYEVRRKDFTELTGLEATMVTRKEELRKWLNGEFKCGLRSMRGPIINKRIKKAEGKLKDILLCYRDLNMTSVKKLDKMLVTVSNDQRLRGMFRFHGAATGRWSGKIVQFQNLKRPHEVFDAGAKFTDELVKELFVFDKWYDEKMGSEIVSSLVRYCIQAPKGKKLFCADYSGIELCVSAWLVGDADLVAKIESGADLYMDMASDIFGYQVTDKKTQGYERKVGKAAVLGLGYQMGARKFSETMDDQDIDLGELDPKFIVDTYRSGFGRRIRTSWQVIQDAMMRAVRNPGKVVKVFGRIAYKLAGDTLYCRLPSGRFITYPFIKVVREEKFGREVDSVYVRNTTKEKPGRDYDDPKFSFIKLYDGWEYTSLYGGKLLENCAQAISADLLRYAISKVNKTWPVVLHVHDEIVSEVDDSCNTFDDFCNTMALYPEWAEGCPISVEGWEGNFYRK